MKFEAFASSSSGNLYTLTDGETSLIIECGVSYKEMQRLLPKPPTSYDACIYSHKHGDHYNRKTADHLKSRGVAMCGDWVDCGVEFAVNSIRVQGWLVKHDAENWMYMFQSKIDSETCIFLIDTFYCPVVPNFSPNIVAIECNYARDLMQPGDSINDRLFASHMSLSQCINTLLAWDLSKTREIHLIHLSDTRSDEDRFIREVQEATGVPTYAEAKRR